MILPNAENARMSHIRQATMLIRAILYWMLVFEWLAHWRGWRGVSWLNHRVLPLLTGALLAPGRMPLRVLALAAPISFVLQVIAGSIRRHALNPLRRLMPGRYADRAIERIDIPMAEGVMPGLYIVPKNGARHAICVLHGSGCDKTYYAWRLADALIARGMAVLLVDLDGHGESRRLQRWPESLEVPIAGVSWLAARHAAVSLIGISLGGCLAAHAVAGGLPVARLVLLEAPPRLRFTHADQRSEAIALLQPFVFDILAESSLYYQLLQVIDLIRAQYTPQIRAAISTWELIDRCALTTNVARINTPLMLIYGERDAIVKPSQAHEVRTAAPASAHFVLVPEASHLTLILHQPTLQQIALWCEAAAANQS